MMDARRHRTRPELSRRALLRHIAIGAAGIAVCEATGMPVALADAGFVVATDGGSWADGIRAAFVDQAGFAKKYGTAPSFLLGHSSVLIARLLAQPGSPPFSATDLLDAEYFLAADSGILQDYDLDLVPNYADIFPSARLAPRAGLQHWSAGMTLPIIGMTWNTKEASKPTSWHDLWNAKYKGRIAIPEFGWYGLTWLHAVNKQLSGTEDNVDRGIAAIAELVKKNGAVVLANQEQAIRAFTQGQIIMMPYWNGRTFGLQSDGVPVDIAYVPGTIQLHNGFVIPKHAPEVKLANEFVNNTLDGQLQVEMTRRFRYPPANSKAKLPPDLSQFVITQAALENVVQLDFQKINATRADNLKRWNSEVLG
jgi:putative spermidine/putrescine transport system substrate-binding protein